MPSMFHTINLVYLVASAIIYFAILSALFRLRSHVGIGAFFCALGVMHFLETYLASVAYVALPFGIVASPGSTVLFTGKLMLLLLVYIHEDAVVVRQPIYGLLVGNILVVMLAYLMRNHALMAISPERVADLGFLNEMGVLMVWGTGILFIDCILIILLYERSRLWFGQNVFARLAVSGAVVLTFDQFAFFAGLHVLTGAGLSVLIGGWAAKMGAVAVYTLLVGGYLCYFERRQQTARAPKIGDIFDILTYRERYEDLLAERTRTADGTAEFAAASTTDGVLGRGLKLGVRVRSSLKADILCGDLHVSLWANNRHRTRALAKTLGRVLNDRGASRLATRSPRSCRKGHSYPHSPGTCPGFRKPPHSASYKLGPAGDGPRAAASRTCRDLLRLGVTAADLLDDLGPRRTLRRPLPASSAFWLRSRCSS